MVVRSIIFACSLLSCLGGRPFIIFHEFVGCNMIRNEPWGLVAGGGH